MFNNFNLIQLLWRALWSVLGSFIATLGQWWQTVVGWNLTTWQWGLIALGTFLVLWLVLSYWRRITTMFRAARPVTRIRNIGVPRWISGLQPAVPRTEVRGRLIASGIFTGALLAVVWWLAPKLFWSAVQTYWFWLIPLGVFIGFYSQLPNNVASRFDRQSRPTGEDRNAIYNLLDWKPRGFWWGPIKSFFWLGGAVLLASLLLAWLAMSQITKVNPTYFKGDTWWTLYSIAVMLLNTFAWINSERKEVPIDHVAVIKRFGRAVRIYLTNGVHRIPLAWVLSCNKDQALGAVHNSQEDNADNPGLVYVGVVTVRLDGEEEGQAKMPALALDLGKVQIRPTFHYRCIDPRTRLSQNMPIKSLNEAAREMIRRITGGVTTSPQLNSLHGVIGGTAAGARAYFVRTRRSDPKNGVHGGDIVINEVNRRAMFVLGPEEFSQDVADELRDNVKDHGETSFLDAASLKRGQDFDRDTIEVTNFHQAHTLGDALKKVGYTLDQVPSIGEVDAPDPVVVAAGKVAAEVKERLQMIANAETNVATAAIYRRDGNLDPRTSGILTASEQNPNVKVFHFTNQEGESVPAVMVNTN